MIDNTNTQSGETKNVSVIKNIINEVKTNHVSTLNNKVGRPSGSGKTPKLVCLITGKQRTTNISYLKEKANKLGVEVSDIVSNYLSKEVQKVLNQEVKQSGSLNEQIIVKTINYFKEQGKVSQTVENISVEKVETALYMNGKNRSLKNNAPF